MNSAERLEQAIYTYETENRKACARAACPRHKGNHQKREDEIMQLVEQHVINRKDPRFEVIDAAAFASKNLYNVALYAIRQAYIFEGRYLSYNEMDKRMQQHEAYKALPAKVSQQILMVLDRNWTSFREARKAYEEDPSKFTGRPKLPKYKHKTEGRNILVYTIQAISKKGLKHGVQKDWTKVPKAGTFAL